MKKIVIFIPSLRGGGVEKTMVNLANGIADRGISVDLIVANAVGPNLANISKKVHLIDFKRNHVSLCLLKLIHFLKHTQPKVLLSAMGHTNVIALLANILAGNCVRVTISIRNHLSSILALNISFRGKILFFLSKYLYSKADKIIAISKNVAEDVIDLYKLPKNLVETIYNPVLVDRVFKLASEETKYIWLQKQDHYPLIVSVGRLEKQKNFSLLIKAFAILLQHIPARLLILGEGSLRPSLEGLISDLNLSDKISMPGYVNNPYVFMKNCDLFVLSSNYEGLGNVLVEALALAPRIVATDSPGGSREILADGKYGWLVKVGDVEGLSKAMLKALKNEPQQCDAAFLAKFKPETVVPQYLQVLLEK